MIDYEEFYNFVFIEDVSYFFKKHERKINKINRRFLKYNIKKSIYDLIRFDKEEEVRESIKIVNECIKNEWEQRKLNRIINSKKENKKRIRL